MLSWEALCVKCCFMVITFIASTGVIYLLFEWIRTKWEKWRYKDEENEE